MKYIYCNTIYISLYIVAYIPLYIAAIQGKKRTRGPSIPYQSTNALYDSAKEAILTYNQDT